MIAGLAAALALAASPAPPLPQAAAAADPVGDLIQKATGAVTDAVATVEMRLRATLYHGGTPGLGTRDSLGCKLQPMRTVAIDPKVFPRHSVIFIKETVGLKLPDGSVHDGFWYASDIGGAIKGSRIDLFTGFGKASMKVLRDLNMTTISAVKVGVFEGCPAAKSPTMVAANN